MGGSNLETLQRLFSGTGGVDAGPLFRGAFVTGDTSAATPEQTAWLAAYLDLYAPDAEVDLSGMEMPDFGVGHGVEGLRELWSRWMENWEHYHAALSNWGEVGDHVIVDAEIRATGRSSGVEVIWHQCQVFTFRGGKVIRHRICPDRAAALAGIEDQ
jgi:ketosteroid isomerase-like protein